MTTNINNLKNKIIYKSTYRGNKELDTLLSSFVNKIIHNLTVSDLKDLLELIETDDENLYRWIIGSKIHCNIKENKISLMLKNYKK